MKIKVSPYSTIIATLYNIILLFLVYFICRVAYVWENWGLFSIGWNALSVGDLLRGGFRFDASAIAYTNALYILLMLLPFHLKERDWWHTLCKWLYMIINSLAIILNLADAVYSKYTGRRTTFTFFSEFSNESNLQGVLFTELVYHWYLLILCLALIVLLCFLYMKPTNDTPKRMRTRVNMSSQGSMQTYYAFHALTLLLFIPLTIMAMRGGISKDLHPITTKDANQYVNKPLETAIVLNTPFSLIRTVDKTHYYDPQYFTAEELEKIYSPLHQLTATVADSSSMADSVMAGSFKGKNIVIIIVESLGRENMGFYNNGNESNTPFLDSLLSLSVSWEESYANGRKSIDALPSIIASIPMFVEPFMVTDYSCNKVGGIAKAFDNQGYKTEFFHGAEDISMGFKPFATATGFQKYHDRRVYDIDSRFGGERDYDGTWAIWDEPFLQYFATKMGEMEEPFLTTVLTASSHPPYHLPEKYKKSYSDVKQPFNRSLRYADNALRKFFETASKFEWFENTLFVITGDHTSKSNQKEYQTSLGVYSVPLFIYDPSGQLKPTVRPGVAQHIDIMPTLLGLMGYEKPYIAFGQDLFNTIKEENWTVNYSNGVYQLLMNDTLILFDGEKVIGTYLPKRDPLLKSPVKSEPASHVNLLKAIIQQYMKRMVENKLTEK